MIFDNLGFLYICTLKHLYFQFQVLIIGKIIDKCTLFGIKDCLLTPILLSSGRTKHPSSPSNETQRPTCQILWKSNASQSRSAHSFSSCNNLLLVFPLQASHLSMELFIFLRPFSLFCTFVPVFMLQIPKALVFTGIGQWNLADVFL